MQRLVAEGYEVSIRSNHLVIGHVPYLDASGEVQLGELVSELNVTGDRTTRPDPHTVFFTGVPHYAAAQPFHQIIASIGAQEVLPGLTANSYLSTKPGTGYYENYYDKMTQYVRLIAGRARTVDPEATARTFRPIRTDTDESPFVYLDSASARARISDLSQRLAVGPVGIIGLGGTGSYILDFVAKTPVPAIHLWDPDVFLAHNAFRAPGAATLDQLNERKKKVDYFAEVYSAMHRGIIPHAESINEDNLAVLTGLDFVFVAIDTGPTKRLIIEWLIQNGIPLIDVGMGVNRQKDALGGIVRATTVTPSSSDHVSRRISFGDEQNDEYERNIQLADLNALNAALAVIKWKKLKGFYRDDLDEAHTTYTVAAGQLTNSEIPG
ncbi:ThiF family adenylyltransferase [Streptomyces sp. ISL-90]|nr:ThiF family adenylyltransferase [Streptomyces sp. ISL-90]